MTLGEKIQQLRKAGGLSQEQLAEQLDVSRQSVSKWELGDAVPDISKIIMISELFSVSTDELLKQNNSNVICKEITEHPQDKTLLEDVVKMNMANKQITMGFITVVIGIIMFVIELMFLPVFGTLQKEQVNSQGFWTDFMKYADVQPMPIVFTLTGVIVFVGLGFMLVGFMYKTKHKK
ncbi:MAG: helix-turn-helix domain-containing protein [Eubacteriales bacterium]